MTTRPASQPETARALLYRHGLPEDVLDGALALFAQELAGKIRAHRDSTRGAVQATKVMDFAADLISPENWARTDPTPCSQPNPCEDGELCATHEEEQAHAEGEHEFCGITCETQMPSALMRNSIVAHGIPGTAGMLDELLRRAAAGLIPAVQEPGPDVVAYRDPDKHGALWCRKHGARWWGLTPLTSGDLPDGGVCGDCGVDVLIAAPAALGEPKEH